MIRRNYFPEPVSEKTLRNSFLADSRFTAWGTFFLSENGSSQEYWIQDFEERGSTEYRLKSAVERLNSRDGSGFWLLNNQGQEARFIPRENIFWVQRGSRDYQAVVGGYLLWIGNTSQTVSRYISALEQVLRGERPALLDSGLFLRVAAEKQGQQLKVLCLNSEEDRYQVYSAVGQEVEHEVCFPLSYQFSSGSG